MDNNFVMTQEEALAYVMENNPAGGIPNSLNIFAEDVRLYTYHFEDRNGKVIKTTHQAYKGTEYIGTDSKAQRLIGEGYKPVKGAMFIIK
jgi:hypothetical protein